MLEIQCIEKLLLEGKIRFPLKVISLNFVAVAAVVDVFFFCVCYCCTLFSIVNVNMIMIKGINLNFKQECKTRSTMSFS